MSNRATIGPTPTKPSPIKAAVPAITVGLAIAVGGIPPPGAPGGGPAKLAGTEPDTGADAAAVNNIGAAIFTAVTKVPAKTAGLCWL